VDDPRRPSHSDVYAGRDYDGKAAGPGDDCSDDDDVFRDYDKPNDWGAAADIFFDELDALEERGSSSDGGVSTSSEVGGLDDDDDNDEGQGERVQNLEALRAAHDAALMDSAELGKPVAPPALLAVAQARIAQPVGDYDDEDFDLEERLRAEGLALSMTEPGPSRPSRDFAEPVHHALAVPPAVSDGPSSPRCGFAETVDHHRHAQALSPVGPAADEEDRAWAEADAWAEAGANLGESRRRDDADDYVSDPPSSGSLPRRSSVGSRHNAADAPPPGESSMQIISPQRRPRGPTKSSGCLSCGPLLERLENVTSGIGAMQCVTAALAADAAEAVHAGSKASTTDANLHDEVAQLRITLDMITRLVLAEAYRARDRHIS
jgi:hypothetical protein